MTPPGAQPPNPSTVRCPTCRASQEWSDTCRRCRSDLRLLRRFAQGYDQARHACLVALRDGHPRAALDAARHCHALAPSAESRRLLTTAALHLHDWPTALDDGRRFLATDITRRTHG